MKTILRDSDGGKWVVLTDHRGTTIYGPSGGISGNGRTTFSDHWDAVNDIIQRDDASIEHEDHREIDRQNDVPDPEPRRSAPSVPEHEPEKPDEPDIP